MNKETRYLTLPEGLVLYTNPDFKSGFYLGICDQIFSIGDSKKLLKAVPPELGKLVKVAVTEKHLTVIDGDIRSASKLTDESVNYLRGLINEAL